MSSGLFEFGLRTVLKVSFIASTDASTSPAPYSASAASAFDSARRSLSPIAPNSNAARVASSAAPEYIPRRARASER